MSREDEIRRIGRQLRLQREKSGRTLDQLASTAGLSARAVRDLEAGRTNPTLSTVVSIVEALGVTVDEILSAARRDLPAADYTAAHDGYSGVTLTRSLPEPRMKAWVVDLGRPASAPLPAGAAFVHVLDGEVVATLDGDDIRLGSGDSFHAQAGVLRALRGASGRLLLVETAAAGSTSQQELV